MKKLLYFTCLVFLFSSLHTYAIGPLDFGVRLGASTPNENMAEIYNSNEIIGTEGAAASLLGDVLGTGYHVGARLRFNLPMSNFSIVGGLALHRFPETSISVDYEGETHTLSTSVNLIPITADLQYQLIDLTLVKFYVQGGLSYNQIRYSVDYNLIPVSLAQNIQQDGSDSRIGAGFGAGIDISLALLSINVFGEYNLTNVIGMEDSENSKRYLALGVGVYF